MQIIRQNPFRVLGLTGNATEKELQKQISIIKRYAEVGKSKSFEYDFEIVGELIRNLDEIQHAASKIEQASKKLQYSLFWFVKNNNFDEIALNNIKDNNPGKAIDVWEKTLKNEISIKNFTSYLNLSTLFLALSFQSEEINVKTLKKALSLKGQLIHSDEIKSYSKLVTGNGMAINSTEISKLFVEDVIEHLKPTLNKNTGLTIPQLISLFDDYPNSIKKHIFNIFTDLPISQIENKIEETAEKRKEQPLQSIKFGEELYYLTKHNVELLRELMGSDNLHVQQIINKLGFEILQCAIDYYNYILNDKDKNEDPGEDSLRIAKYATSLNTTGQTKGRIDENIEVIQDWVDNKDARQKRGAVQSDIDAVLDVLKGYDTVSYRIGTLKETVEIVRSRLIKIKEALGAEDDYYLDISSAMVTFALAKTINLVNNDPDTTNSAYNIVKSLQNFDMYNDVALRLAKNVQIISENKSNMSSSSSCYIATMAYGHYNHPQVIVLRLFRDSVLVNSLLGRVFIQFYYTLSPWLVKLLQDNQFANRSIRAILDKFIKDISK